MVVRPYLVPAALLALLLALQAQLWFGRGSVPSVDALKNRLEQLEADNAAMRLTNEQLANEIRDLQEGLEVVEAYARQELGMVKANEIFVQYAKPKGSGSLSGSSRSSAQAATPAASSSSAAAPAKPAAGDARKP
jgi:cell division protein FtsB